MNLYAYAGNNPISFSDPYGLSDCDKEKDPNCTLAGQVLAKAGEWLSGVRGELVGALAEASNVVVNAINAVLPGPKKVAEGAAGVTTEGATLSGPAQAGKVTGGLAEAGLGVVLFKSPHAARHLAGTGLKAAEVESAIAGQVASSTKGATVVGTFSGRVTVAGAMIQYRGYPLANGAINVGTYFPVP